MSRASWFLLGVGCLLVSVVFVVGIAVVVECFPGTAFRVRGAIAPDRIQPEELFDRLKAGGLGFNEIAPPTESDRSYTLFFPYVGAVDVWVHPTTADAERSERRSPPDPHTYRWGRFTFYSKYPEQIQLIRSILER
jgi:hypothetical protein